MIARYLFMRHLRVLLSVLAFAVLALWMGQFADTTRYLGGETGADAALLLWRALLRSPSLLQYALPHAALIATVMVIHRMSAHSELAILAGSGRSGLHMLLPLAASAALVGGLFVLAVNPLASAALDRAEVIDRQTLGLRGAAGARNVALRTETGTAYVFARDVSPEGDGMARVTAFLLDDRHRLQRRLDIDRLTRSPEGVWTATGYTETIGATLPRTIEPPDPLPFDPAIMLADLRHRQATAIYDLPRAAALAEATAAQPLPYLFQFHWLIALPGLLGAVTFFAGALSLRLTHTHGWGRRAAEILALSFPIYALITIVEAIAIRGLVAPVVAAWSAPAAMVLGGLALLQWRRL